jgi:hypothetical protein
MWRFFTTPSGSHTTCPSPSSLTMTATEMIAHHEGAIEMAKQVENSANSEVSALAKNIIASQTAEIAQLKAFLAK